MKTLKNIVKAIAYTAAGLFILFFGSAVLCGIWEGITAQ